MSDPGNRRPVGWVFRHRGFTLLELMLVVAMAALVGSGVAFALRDTNANQLEREAQRLAAMLEVARTQSRASGNPVYWRPYVEGFELVADKTVRTSWLVEGTLVEGAQLVVLGPEPIIDKQNIVLVGAGVRVRVFTDGLRPFEVRSVSGAGDVATGS